MLALCFPPAYTSLTVVTLSHFFIENSLVSDPQDNIPFAEVLYSNFDFTEALFNALSDDGIMVMQLGQSPFHDNPPDEISPSHQRAKLIKGLQEFGFQSMHTYEEVR